MPSFEARITALRWLYVAVLFAAAAYLGHREAPAVSLVVVGLGLWRVRRWLHARAAAAWAARAPWRRHAAIGLELEAPSTWTAEVLPKGEHLHVDGRGVGVDVLWVPTTETPERCATRVLSSLESRRRLHDARPVRGTLAGHEAAGHVAEYRAFDESGTFEVLAARTPAGRLLVAIVAREFAVPAALPRRVLASLTVTSSTA